MLTEVKVYSSLEHASTILLDENGSPETDFIQIRNIDGLEPVKASVNTSPTVGDGEFYTGSNIPSRNIVLTVRPNRDYDWSYYDTIRQSLYEYFTPKREIQLEFYSGDVDPTPPVKITGIVEDVQINMFSDDPEWLVSIICPDPYFIAIEPKVITGESIRSEGEVEHLDYRGSADSGLLVKVSFVSGDAPTVIGIQLGDPEISYFNVEASVDNDKYFEMCSIPRQKFVQNVSTDISPTAGVITSLLSEIQEGSTWPTLKAGGSSFDGHNRFSVVTDSGIQDYELTFYERFVGL